MAQMTPERDEMTALIAETIEKIEQISGKYYGFDMSALGKLLMTAGINVMHAAFLAQQADMPAEDDEDEDDPEEGGNVYDFSDILKNISRGE